MACTRFDSVTGSPDELVPALDCHMVQVRGNSVALGAQSQYQAVPAAQQ